MLESRQTYGYGGSSVGKTDKASLKKYQVCYRDEWGGYGEIGYKLFDTEKQALEFGEQLKKETGYITEIMVKHLSPTYSNY